MELTSAIITDPADAEWIDAAERDNLPAGVKVKILSQDPDTGRKDMYVYFEPGYVEPRHTHIGQHSDVLLEGRWIIEGIEVGPGGYIYGPPNVRTAPSSARTAVSSSPPSSATPVMNGRPRPRTNPPPGAKSA